MHIEREDFSGKEPNIEKLKEHIAKNGNVIKNYKELCKILEISSKTNTESRNKQKNELLCYFEYRISGYKIIVDEIFDTPKKITSHERSTYGADIESTILRLITESTYKGVTGNKVLYINMKELCEELGFVNMSFNKYKYNKQNLKKRAEKLFTYYGVPILRNNTLQIETDALIEYFYNKIYLQITQTIKRNLKRLQDKQIIQCEPVYEYHPDGVSYNVKWYIDANGETREKYAVIETCRLELMAEMKEEINCQRKKRGKPAYSKLNMSHIFIYGKEEEYFRRLNEMYEAKLIKCFGASPKYIIPAYKISLHPTTVKKLLENMDYLETATNVDPLYPLIRINNKILNATYRGFKKTFNIITGYAEDSFSYIDNKTGEVCNSNETQIRNKCFDIKDQLRFKIVQRLILLLTDNINEDKQNEYGVSENWFIDMLLNDEEPIANFIDIE